MVNTVRIDKDNYHLFDDMIYWRVNGQERSDEYAPSISKEIKEELDNQNLYIYAVTIVEKMVGWISLIYMPKVGKFKGRGHIYVDELWVEPSRRGRGLGMVLMNKAEDLCTELDCTGIRLYVSRDNDSAIGLYKECGYDITGDTYFMEK